MTTTTMYRFKAEVLEGTDVATRYICWMLTLVLVVYVFALCSLASGQTTILPNTTVLPHTTVLARPPITPGFQQACNKIGDTTGTTIVCSFASKPSSGDLIVSILYSPSGYSSGTCSDGGSTYVTLTQYANASNFITQVCYTLSFAGTGTGITWTNTFMGGSNYVAGVDYNDAALSPWGLDANTPDTTTRAQSTTATGTALSNSATPANANVLLVGLIGSTNAHTFTTPTDSQGDTVTMRTVNVTYPIIIEDVIVSSAKAYAMGLTLTNSSSDEWNAHYLAFY
jgi:hypothetical protein